MLHWFHRSLGCSVYRDEHNHADYTKGTPPLLVASSLVWAGALWRWLPRVPRVACAGWLGPTAPCCCGGAVLGSCRRVQHGRRGSSCTQYCTRLDHGQQRHAGTAEPNTWCGPVCLRRGGRAAAGLPGAGLHHDWQAGRAAAGAHARSGCVTEGGARAQQRGWVAPVQPFCIRACAVGNPCACCLRPECNEADPAGGPDPCRLGTDGTLACRALVCLPKYGMHAE